MHKAKCLLLLLASILAVSNLAMVNLASAQSTPTVPNFNVTFTAYPYYNGSQTLRNGTVEITILNQPFTPYKDQNNHTLLLYYNFRCKGHDNNNWDYYCEPGKYSEASTSDKTTFRYLINEAWEDLWVGMFPNIPDDGQMDFQVEAFIGYSYPVLSGNVMQQQIINVYVGQTSGWSNTQTINVSENSSSTSGASTVPEIPTFKFLPLILIMPLLVAAVLRRKLSWKT